MKKLIIMLMIGLISFSTVACQNKNQVKETTNVVEKVSTNETNGVENEKSVDVEKNIDEEDLGDKLKKNIDKLLPELVDATKRVFVKNCKKIDPKLDMEHIQVILFSNITHKAYLFNSQNEKYGKPEESIEYSTDTFKNEGLLTRMFDMTEFNGHNTYLFNIDTFANNQMSKDELKEELLKSIVHEGVHLVLQNKLEKDLKTAEEMMGASRSIAYPLEFESRIYRTQQAKYYKLALESKTAEERIEFIKTGNYFYKKYIDLNPQNIADSEFDKIEGQPRYYEYKALALLENSDLNGNELEKLTRKLYLEKNYEIESDIMTQMGKNGEFYSVGSLGYANIYALGTQNEFGFQNPSKYLLDKYGYTENNGDEKLAREVEKYYNEINKNIKQRVDSFTNKMNDKEYKTIKIPIFYKYEENSNMEFEEESINYKYKDEENTLEKVSREIKLGNNRILIKSADIMLNGNENGEFYYINIAKKDIEIEENRLTVQLKELQVYGNKFKEVDGIYELEE